MKNLIDEIENLKRQNGVYNSFPFNEGLDEAIKVLNQYNIITAPKSIKLSEIVSKLGLNKRGIITRNKFRNEIEISEEIIMEINGDNFYDECYLLGIKDNKIYDSNITLDNRTKWLHALWVAGTEIIDDLECVK